MENKKEINYNQVVWLLMGAIVLLSLILGWNMWTLSTLERRANDMLDQCEEIVKNISRQCILVQPVWTLGAPIG